MTPESYDMVLTQIAVDPGETTTGLACVVTCGACGFTWNDALSTELTPAPAARCPNEYNHEEEDNEL